MKSWPFSFSVISECSEKSFPIGYLPCDPLITRSKRRTVPNLRCAHYTKSSLQSLLPSENMLLSFCGRGKYGEANLHMVHPCFRQKQGFIEHRGRLSRVEQVDETKSLCSTSGFLEVCKQTHQPTTTVDLASCQVLGVA